MTASRAFIDPNTVVVAQCTGTSQCSAGKDTTAAVFDAAAHTIAAAGFTVIRDPVEATVGLPGPDVRHQLHELGWWATDLSSPWVFDHRQADAAAKNRLESYFPGRDVHVIEMLDSWASGGGVHCHTNDQPAPAEVTTRPIYPCHAAPMATSSAVKKAAALHPPGWSQAAYAPFRSPGFQAQGQIRPGATGRTARHCGTGYVPAVSTTARCSACHRPWRPSAPVLPSSSTPSPTRSSGPSPTTGAPGTGAGTRSCTPGRSARAFPFYLLFAPPVTGDVALFVWMLVWVNLARIAITLFYIPNVALGAELTEDYHERSSVVGYRTFFRSGGAGSAR